MSILEDIQQAVDRVAQDHGLATSAQAFGYWFLEEIEDFAPEEAEELITDGPWDRGRDAVYFDEDARRLSIYQFKYSTSPDYVGTAFTDIQRAVTEEETKLSKIDSLRLIIVTIASAGPDLQQAARRAQRRIRTWMTRRGFRDVDTSVELFDLTTFRQVFERLYGVDVDLTFRTPPLEFDSALIGLTDARAFADHIENDALFAFNIRKFLGLRRGSVNWQMKQTLENDEDRPNFWMYNNGIVCLCTGWQRRDLTTMEIENLTIVNGAQTISTIARFAANNPALDDPIWVVCKLLKVSENDLDKARVITKTSNTQTPTSNKDLRAVDPVHRRIQRWLEEYFNISYVYRRGTSGPRDRPSISMKEMLQAYVAYHREEPELAFSRVGQLFASNEAYEDVFPSDEIAQLQDSGDRREIEIFLTRRLLPWRLLMGIRQELGARIRAGTFDKKWRSGAYHLVWLYRQLISVEAQVDERRTLDLVDDLLSATVADLVDAFVEACWDRREEVPRLMKSAELRRDLIEQRFLERPFVRAIRATVRNVLS